MVSKACRNWVRIVQACVDIGDTMATRMLSAFAVILFQAFPPSRQRLIEKSIETGELFLDPHDSSYVENNKDVVESIIAVIANDSHWESIKRIVCLLKEDSTCSQKPYE